MRHFGLLLLLTVGAARCHKAPLLDVPQAAIDVPRTEVDTSAQVAERRPTCEEVMDHLFDLAMKDPEMAVAADVLRQELQNGIDDCKADPNVTDTVLRCILSTANFQDVLKCEQRSPPMDVQLKEAADEVGAEVEKATRDAEAGEAE